MPTTSIISGGSRGLGLAVVERLLDRGDCVATFSRSGSAALAALASRHADRLLAERIDAAGAMFVEAGVELTSSLAPGVLVTAPTGVMSRVVDELLGSLLRGRPTKKEAGLWIAAWRVVAKKRTM